MSLQDPKGNIKLPGLQLLIPHARADGERALGLSTIEAT